MLMVEISLTLHEAVSQSYQLRTGMHTLHSPESYLWILILDTNSVLKHWCLQI